MVESTENTASHHISPYNGFWPIQGEGHIPALRPTTRERQRYLTYEAHTSMPIDPTTLRASIQEELLSFLGELTYGEAGIQMMNVQRNQGVIRMNHTHVDQVKTGLMMIQDIQGQPANVHSVTVSGMIHKARGRLTL